MQQAIEICPTKTFEKVKQGALLVDVRRNHEVDEVTFDVPNYMHIPIDELENRIGEIPKDQEIIMVCSIGERSLKTTYFLMNNGYEKVFNMRDGLNKWVQKGFPTKGNTDELVNESSCGCSC